jgi:hypothetical protein
MRSPVVSASQRASIHSTCGNRSNPARCNGIPHSVWLVPCRQACTEPQTLRQLKWANAMLKTLSPQIVAS